jgi:hypothetical protein
VTLIPMAFVTSTTMTAGVLMAQRFISMRNLTGVLNLSLTVFVMASVAFILLWALNRWLLVLRGVIAVKPETAPPPKDAITALPAHGKT